MKSLIQEVLITLVLAVALFFLARATIQTYEVFQTSMLPNFSPGERVVVNKAVYWFGAGPKRGDVVILRAPNGVKENWIKRIIGLPGDTVAITDGKVYVNGVLLDEPYIKMSFTYSMDKITVPDGEYFFLGDNRDVSNDSHRGWFMPRANLIGKAWIISWPPSSWSIARNYNLNGEVNAAVP